MWPPGQLVPWDTLCQRVVRAGQRESPRAMTCRWALSVPGQGPHPHGAVSWVPTLTHTPRAMPPWPLECQGAAELRHYHQPLPSSSPLFSLSPPPAHLHHCQEVQRISSSAGHLGQRQACSLRTAIQREGQDLSRPLRRGWREASKSLTASGVKGGKEPHFTAHRLYIRLWALSPQPPGRLSPHLTKGETEAWRRHECMRWDLI